MSEQAASRLRKRHIRRYFGVLANVARLLAIVWLGVFIAYEWQRTSGLLDGGESRTLLLAETAGLVVMVVVIAIDLYLRLRDVQQKTVALKASIATNRSITRAADSEVMSVRRGVAMWVHGTVQSAVIAARTSSIAAFESFRSNSADSEKVDLGLARRSIDELESRLNEILSDLSGVVRERARELWPEHRELPLKPALDKIGGPTAVIHLTPALDWSDVNTDEIEPSREKVRELRETKKRLSVQSRYEVVRIVEEALNNGRKFGSTRESVVVNLDHHTISIEVANNGARLDPEYKPGLGLAVIAEIATRRNGTWSIRNLPQGVMTKARFEVDVAGLDEIASSLYKHA